MKRKNKQRRRFEITTNHGIFTVVMERVPDRKHAQYRTLFTGRFAIIRATWWCWRNRYA